MAVENIQIVLVRTTHAGNIGASARVMRNMGLKNLALVAPKNFPSDEARTRASGADDVLDNARIYPDLDAAIAGSRYVLGTSARLRSIEWPSQMPREAVQTVANESQHGQVSVVFGQEKSGLSNLELDRCHSFVRVPVDDEFSSLNLSAAVALMAYELRLTYLAESMKTTHQLSEDKSSQTGARGERATAAQMRSFYEHLHAVLTQIEFIDSRPSIKLFRKLIRLYNRARPTQEEINILRGILSATQRKAR